MCELEGREEVGGTQLTANGGPQHLRLYTSSPDHKKFGRRQRQRGTMLRKVYGTGRYRSGLLTKKSAEQRKHPMVPHAKQGTWCYSTANADGYRA